MHRPAGLPSEANGAEGQTVRKIVYSVAMSLDGYVAGPNGEADWITMDPEIDFAAVFARFDTVLMGRKTYEQVKAMGEGGAMPGMMSIIASRTLNPEDCPGATLIGDGLTDRLCELQAASGKDIWLFGGGVLFRSLLDAGLVDEVSVALMPVLLGGGVPLLAAGHRAKLRLTGNRVYKSGIVSLEYAVEADRAQG
jgi:dihydrofolate reductase